MTDDVAVVVVVVKSVFSSDSLARRGVAGERPGKQSGMRRKKLGQMREKKNIKKQTWSTIKRLLPKLLAFGPRSFSERFSRRRDAYFIGKSAKNAIFSYGGGGDNNGGGIVETKPIASPLFQAPQARPNAVVAVAATAAAAAAD
jgi:hypothetical protein